MEQERELLISILIPCYNHEKFLPDCLESIINQTYKYIEVIICDDCSLDNSWEIIQKYQNRLILSCENVVILRREKNCGITMNLNYMIDMCKGEIVKPLASDDFLANNYCEELANFCKKNSDIDVIICNGNKVLQKASYLFIGEKCPVYLEEPDLEQDTFLARLYNENFIFAPGAAVKRKIYDIYGKYDETLAIEDWEYWLRLACTSKVKFGYINKKMVYYRQNENSMTSMASSDLASRRMKIYCAEMKIIDLYGAFVAPEIYANKIITRILYEKSIAYRFDLNEMKKKISKDWKNFKYWRLLDCKTNISLRVQNYKIALGKVIAAIKGTSGSSTKV